MKKIDIGNNKEIIVDNENYNNLRQYKWKLSKGGYPKRRINIYLHHLILKPPIGFVIDHINGNPLDCRKSNLRIATKSQNAHNQDFSSRNTSGFRGVHWDKKAKKWRASIKVNNKKINLGDYTIKEEAAEIYNEAAKQYFGEFARLNYV